MLKNECKTKRTELLTRSLFALAVLLSIPRLSEARDVEYNGGDISVNLTPGEPTQLQFPGKISGGFKKKGSAVSLDKKDRDLVLFASENLADSGEAIIVRLEDGRSYSVRAQRASGTAERDSMVTINDSRGGSILSKDEEIPEYVDKRYPMSSPNQVSGLMREVILAAEFGKSAIPGYQTSEQYRGQVVLDDGTVTAKIDQIFMGSSLWAYVLTAENRLDTTQRINPATFRLDGTRAISMSNWELSPRPLTGEQQLAGTHKAKVYIITKPKN